VPWTVASAWGTGVGLLRGAGVGLAVMTISLGLGAVRGPSADIGYFYGAGLVLSGLVAALATGFAIGTAQWGVLRSRMPDNIRWARATTVGLIVALLGVAGIYQASKQIVGVSGFISSSSEVVQAVVGGSLASMIWSSAQWFVLRRRIRRVGWWIPANGVAAAVAWAVASLILLTPPAGTYGPGAGAVVALAALPAVAAAAVIWGLLTGGTLIWLLRQT